MNTNGGQVFRASLIGQILIIGVCFLFVTIFAFNFDQWWVYFAYLIPVLFLVASVKTKIVLEEEKIVYYTLLGSREVEYTELSEVKMRKTQRFDSDGKRSTSSDFYFLDEEGDMFFTIGLSGVGGKVRKREFFRLLKEKNPEIVLDGYCQRLMEKGVSR